MSWFFSAVESKRFFFYCVWSTYILQLVQLIWKCFATVFKCRIAFIPGLPQQLPFLMYLIQTYNTVLLWFWCQPSAKMLWSGQQHHQNCPVAFIRTWIFFMKQNLHHLSKSWQLLPDMVRAGCPIKNSLVWSLVDGALLLLPEELAFEVSQSSYALILAVIGMLVFIK